MFFINLINKGFDYIKLASILHDPDVIATLPEKLQDDEVPSIVYRLNNTIDRYFLTQVLQCNTQSNPDHWGGYTI